MNELLSMGPPVYWVLGNGISFENVKDQNLICGGPGCNNNSLTTSLYLAAKYPELYVRLASVSIKNKMLYKIFPLFRTSMATPSSSWIDDYIDWLSMDETCCKIHETEHTFCPSNGMNDRKTHKKNSFRVYVFCSKLPMRLMSPWVRGEFTNEKTNPGDIRQIYFVFLEWYPEWWLCESWPPGLCAGDLPSSSTHPMLFHSILSFNRPFDTPTSPPIVSQSIIRTSWAIIRHCRVHMTFTHRWSVPGLLPMMYGKGYPQNTEKM